MFQEMSSFSCGPSSLPLSLSPGKAIVIEMFPDATRAGFARCDNFGQSCSMPNVDCPPHDVPRAMPRSRCIGLSKSAQLAFAASIFVRVAKQWKGPRHDC